MGQQKQGEFQDGTFWFKKSDEVLTLGLTDLALETRVGMPSRVELPEEGERYEAGELLGFVEG